jgi:hypothetical protein
MRVNCPLTDYHNTLVSSQATYDKDLSTSRLTVQAFLIMSSSSGF